MPFTIDEDTLLIKGRKGDTASFTFEFDQDISAYTVSFYIKKNLTSANNVIEIEFKNPINKSVTVNLASADTSKLTSLANSYSIYYWGLAISNGIDFEQTIIPQEFKNYPMMHIYPGKRGV